MPLLQLQAAVSSGFFPSAVDCSSGGFSSAHFLLSVSLPLVQLALQAALLLPVLQQLNSLRRLVIVFVLAVATGVSSSFGHAALFVLVHHHSVAYILANARCAS